MSRLEVPFSQGTTDYQDSRALFPFVEKVLALWDLPVNLYRQSILEVYTASDRKTGLYQISCLTGLAFQQMLCRHYRFAMVSMCTVGHTMFYLTKHEYITKGQMAELWRIVLKSFHSANADTTALYQCFEDYVIDCLILAGCFSTTQNFYWLALE